jgi:uncharacterized repeat protein (TIGR03803 family)
MTGIHSSTKRIGLGFLLLAAVLESLVTAAAPARAQTLTTLYSFAGSPSDGFNPYAGVTLDAQGNIYGTTADRSLRYGGCLQDGCGIAFELTPSGQEIVLHHFFSGNNAFPMGGVIVDAKGNLYGTTRGTGKKGCYLGGHYGSVFVLKKQRKGKVLHQFCHYPDGAFPVAGLTVDSKGNLYGTTEEGGAHYWGTVFELAASGTENVLYSFTAGADGASPLGGVILDAQGNLYGTTSLGGNNWAGVAYELTPSGTETVLASFCSQPNCIDGANPNAGLILDAQGNFYGTTAGGGAYGYGTVFKLSPTGEETVLHSFSGTPDGAAPYGGLVMDNQGNLYGTTYGGGNSTMDCYDQGCGTTFKVTPSGSETVLYNFCSQSNCSDGALPTAAMVFDGQGNLYGTTTAGGIGVCGVRPGTPGCGTVFKLTP